MSRCFGSSSNLSAKEYTFKKRNRNMFCDLRTKYKASGSTGTTGACVNDSGVISHFTNNTVQLQIKKGYEEFISTRDASTNYVGQQTKEFCSQYDVGPNTDISNNYTGMLLTDVSGVVDSSVTNINRYAEINTVPVDGNGRFPSGKKIIYELCGTDKPIRNGKMTIT